MMDSILNYSHIREGGVSLEREGGDVFIVGFERR